MRTPDRCSVLTFFRTSRSLKIRPSLLSFKLVAAPISSQVWEPCRMGVQHAWVRVIRRGRGHPLLHAAR